MFKSLTSRTPLRWLLAPFTLGATLAVFSAIAPIADARPIIIRRSPNRIRHQPFVVPQQGSYGNYIYGSPIPTAIPLNPATGKPAVLPGTNFYPTYPAVPVPRHRNRYSNRRVYRHPNTVIIQPSRVSPYNHPYYNYNNYYAPPSGSYFYYDSSGNIQIQVGY